MVSLTREEVFAKINRLAKIKNQLKYDSPAWNRLQGIIIGLTWVYQKLGDQ